MRGERKQFSLQADFDVPQAVLSDIEHGKKDPQLTTIYKIAKAFGLSLSDFMKELEKEL